MLNNYQNNDNFCCGNATNTKVGGIIDNEDPEKYRKLNITEIKQDYSRNQAIGNTISKTYVREEIIK